MVEQRGTKPDFNKSLDELVTEDNNLRKHHSDNRSNPAGQYRTTNYKPRPYYDDYNSGYRTREPDSPMYQ